MPIGALTGFGTLDRIQATRLPSDRSRTTKGHREGAVAGGELRGIPRPKMKVGKDNHAAQQRGANAKNSKLVRADVAITRHEIWERLNFPVIDATIAWMLSTRFEGTSKAKEDSRKFFARRNDRDSQSAIGNDKYDFLRVLKYTRRTKFEISNTCSRIEYSCGERPTTNSDEPDYQRLSYEFALILQQEATELNTIVRAD